MLCFFLVFVFGSRYWVPYGYIGSRPDVSIACICFGDFFRFVLAMGAPGKCTSSVGKDWKGNRNLLKFFRAGFGLPGHIWKYDTVAAVRIEDVNVSVVCRVPMKREVLVR